MCPFILVHLADINYGWSVRKHIVWCVTCCPLSTEAFDSPMWPLPCWRLLTKQKNIFVPSIIPKLKIKYIWLICRQIFKLCVQSYWVQVIETDNSIITLNGTWSGIIPTTILNYVSWSSKHIQNHSIRNFHKIIYNFAFFTAPNDLSSCIDNYMQWQLQAQRGSS